MATNMRHERMLGEDALAGGDDGLRCLDGRVQAFTFFGGAPR